MLEAVDPSFLTERRIDGWKVSPRRKGMTPNGQTSIESRLTRVEVAVQRVESQVGQLMSEFADLKEKVETMLERSRDHQNVLYGDHGKSGLITQGEHLEELEKALKGYGREPGLIADIKNLLTKMGEMGDERKWMTRLVIGAIITEIVLHFIRLP